MISLHTLNWIFLSQLKLYSLLICLDSPSTSQLYEIIRFLPRYCKAKEPIGCRLKTVSLNCWHVSQLLWIIIIIIIGCIWVCSKKLRVCFLGYKIPRLTKSLCAAHLHLKGVRPYRFSIRKAYLFAKHRFELMKKFDGVTLKQFGNETFLVVVGRGGGRIPIVGNLE